METSKAPTTKALRRTCHGFCISRSLLRCRLMASGKWATA